MTAKHTSRTTGHGSPPHLMMPSPRPSPPICRAAGRKGGWVGVGVGGGKQRTRTQASAVLSTCNKWCDWTQGHSTGAAGRQLWACGHGQAWAAHLGYDDRGQPQACCCSQSIGAVASTLHLHPPPPRWCAYQYAAGKGRTWWQHAAVMAGPTSSCSVRSFWSGLGKAAMDAR